MTGTLIISTADIDQILRTVGLDLIMDELISRLGAAFAEYDESEMQAPIRDGFSYDDPVTGLVEWMPCMQVGREVVVKLVGYHPENPRRFGLPTIMSTISAYDTTTGRLTCLMDATLLTAMRTGAASAVATSLLGREDATEIGLIGAGAQAITQLHAVSRVMDVTRVLVFDTDPEACETFAERVRGVVSGIEIASAAPGAVVAESDVICTSTSVEVGMGPVIADEEPRPWAHFNAVGSDFPGKTELPKKLLERCFVVPDFPEQAVREGECQQLAAGLIGPSLAQIAAQPGRAHAHRERLTVFDSTGWALEDAVAMGLFLEHAKRMNLGETVWLESSDVDPRDPYGALRTAMSHLSTD